MTSSTPLVSHRCVLPLKQYSDEDDDDDDDDDDDTKIACSQ